MKTLFSICMTCAVVLFFCISSPAPSIATEEGAEQIHFLWAFGARVAEGQSRKLVSITRDTTLQTGDQIKMLMRLEKPCFVYLIYQNTQGELRLLFPDLFNPSETMPKVTMTHYIPEDEMWFVLDDQVGKEVFHLLASATQLVDLEQQITVYESAESNKKSQHANEILDAIKNLKRQYRSLSVPAKRPVSIGGRIRNASSGIEDFAVEILVPTFYSRTFTIDHQ